MKKLLLILFLPILLLTGCSGDKNIIETTREITFSNGETLEKIVIKKLAVMDFLGKNASSLNIEGVRINFTSDNKDYLLLDDMVYASNGSILPLNTFETLLKKYEIKASNNLDVTWSVLGETDNGKIIRAATDNGRVDTKIVINGDIIEANTNNMVPSSEVYNFKLDPLTEYTAQFVNTFLNMGEEVKATHKVIESSALFKTLDKITSLFSSEKKEVAVAKKEEVAVPKAPEVITETKADFLEKIKNKELKYELLSFEENENEVKTTFIVKSKYLYYTYYKNSELYKNAESEFKNDVDTIFLFDNPYEKDTSYHYYSIEPTMGSGKWSNLLGNNEIIRAGGDDGSEADENLDAFYIELQKLKNGKSANLMKDTKEVKNVVSNVASKEEFLNKIKMNGFKYKYSTFDTKDDNTKITFKIKDHDLEYTYYRNLNQLKKDEQLLLNSVDLFPYADGNFDEDESYYFYALETTMDSKLSGSWYALVGENEIITSHGDNITTANKNLYDFFSELQKLKK